MSRNPRRKVQINEMPKVFEAPTQSNYRGKPIEDALKVIFRQMKASGNRPRTLETYEWNFRKYLEYNNIEFVDELTAQSIYDYLESLEVSQSTKLVRLKSIKAMLGKIYINGWIDEKFWHHIQVKVDKKIKQGTTETDIERLIMMIDKTTFVGFRDACAIILMYKTGIRIRTLGELQEHHIDFDNLLLNLDGSTLKNHQFIKLPFDNEVATMLKMLIKLNNEVRQDNYIKNSYVFITRRGEGINNNKSPNNAISKQLHKYAHEFGFENINPHALRRAFAKGLHEKGASVAIISKALGHSDLSVTTQYLDISADEVAQNLREFI